MSSGSDPTVWMVGSGSSRNSELHTQYTSSMATSETDGRRRAAATRRRVREAEIIAATRAVFDTKGVRDAQIDQVAAAVGINRAII
ncbi:hypothetical protein BH09ACT12_BH09ACT12_31030 [soil metagenome]